MLKIVAVAKITLFNPRIFTSYRSAPGQRDEQKAWELSAFLVWSENGRTNLRWIHNCKSAPSFYFQRRKHWQRSRKWLQVDALHILLMCLSCRHFCMTRSCEIDCLKGSPCCRWILRRCFLGCGIMRVVSCEWSWRNCSNHPRFIVFLCFFYPQNDGEYERFSDAAIPTSTISFFYIWRMSMHGFELGYDVHLQKSCHMTLSRRACT